jgi:hypothetical protein
MIRWPWQRSEQEKIDAAIRIVEAERDLREARVVRAGVDRLGVKVDEFVEAVRTTLTGGGPTNGHARPGR